MRNRLPTFSRRTPNPCRRGSSSRPYSRLTHSAYRGRAPHISKGDFMSNPQVQKLANAYEALANALDGFDWGEPQRCVLGSFTVDGRPGEDVHSELVGNVWIDLPAKTLGRSPVEAEVCHIVVPETRHEGFVALAPMDIDDGDGTWAWVVME